MSNLAVRQEAISLEEAVQLAATDAGFFGQFFFPKTCRQASPEFHREMDDLLDDTTTQFNSFMVFRGGAKTSKVRLFIARRVAYSISRTILVVGKSEGHAVRTLRWLKKAVEFNALYSRTFNLRQGSKWSDTEIEIFHGTDEVPITIIAMGITGSVRGINIDDYRPDLIVVDDPCDEENTATLEQRQKISNLFFGALAKSLAPVSECPQAKMLLLQTPLNSEDLVSQTARDPQWRCVVYGCFDDAGNSRWPARWTAAQLMTDKQAHVNRNQLSLWLREMECKVISDESAYFKRDWLQYWDILPDGGINLLAIDPTPPPRDSESVATAKHDDAVVMWVKLYQGRVYVCNYYIAKSPDEQELISKVFEFMSRCRLRGIAIETHMFQRVLANLIEKEMLRRHQWTVIHRIEDRRHKGVRIRQELSARGSNRTIFVAPHMHEFIEQFITYPNSKHDDLLDALAIGLCAVNPALEAEALDGEYEELHDPELDRMLEHWRGAP